MKTSIFILTCLLCLGACGLKGPLYLPVPEPQQSTEDATEVTEKQAKEKKKDSDSS